MIQDDVLLMNQLVRQRGDASQEFRRGQSVGAPLFDSMGHLFLESRHADFEELVEIGAHDAEKLQSFQQWNLLIFRQIEDAPVEFQEAELAVQVPFRPGEVTRGRPVSPRLRRRCVGLSL